MIDPKTTFDPLIYVDGTLAGIAVLVPVPPLDWLLERIFRRRMLRDIAARHGRVVSPEVERVINREPRRSCWGCLWWPLTAVYSIFKRFSRKLLYFLTIKEASDQVSYYWHRAFLLNYMLTAGHLDTPEQAARARQAMQVVLEDTTTSPLYKFAAQWIYNVQQNWRITLRLFRSRNIQQYLKENEAVLKDNWNEAAGYLSALALRYNLLYEQYETEQKIQLEPNQNSGEASAATPTKTTHEQSEESNLALQEATETANTGETPPTEAGDTIERSETEKD